MPVCCAPMSDETGHQGWTNYETWCVKLWLDNDEGSYDYWREQTREAWQDAPSNVFMDGPDKRDREVQSALASQLKDHFDDSTDQLEGLNDTVYADLLNAALSEVNWHEIAKALIDDERENGTLEDETEDEAEA